MPDNRRPRIQNLVMRKLLFSMLTNCVTLYQERTEPAFGNQHERATVSSR